ncbi:ski oncogene-like isoform X2 [Limulus polyphemus]|uniref:Ski oncogene-like isoform X2 n=1 Tax=Limulus polyphemus TaxID=6850 RepID=A0ABM1S4T0_LIMPO|nr:ski oncogene-like isoform X2 [Limulus polyphemus]
MEEPSTKVYTPHLKRVLKSYQEAALASLQGPNTFMATWNTEETAEKIGCTTVHPKEKSIVGNLSENRVAVSPVVVRSESEDPNETSGTDYDPFLMPPPFPIQLPPIFTPPDRSRCERSETSLKEETISCFSIGGEKRLCLPQILNTVLKDFSLQQINSVCDELHIFCSRCTPEQLEVLKVTGVLPLSAPSCGLITKSDAERLCATLLYTVLPNSEIRGKHLLKFRVAHRCFGKCIGVLVPDLYTTPYAKCIECTECYGAMNPEVFVCHAHHSKENRTCHWGFDSSNWRAYVMLSNDEEEKEKLQQHLEDVKARFERTQSRKRKQMISEDMGFQKKTKIKQSLTYPYLPVTWESALAYLHTGPTCASSPVLSSFSSWPASTGTKVLLQLSPNVSYCIESNSSAYLTSERLQHEPSIHRSSPEDESENYQKHHDPTQSPSLFPPHAKEQKQIKKEPSCGSDWEYNTSCMSMLLDSEELSSMSTSLKTIKVETKTEEQPLSSENQQSAEGVDVSRELDELSTLLQIHHLQADAQEKIMSKVESIISKYCSYLAKTILKHQCLQEEMEIEKSTNLEKLIQLQTINRILNRELLVLKNQYHSIREDDNIIKEEDSKEIGIYFNKTPVHATREFRLCSYLCTNRCFNVLNVPATFYSHVTSVSR